MESRKEKTEKSLKRRGSVEHRWPESGEDSNAGRMVYFGRRMAPKSMGVWKPTETYYSMRRPNKI